MLIAIGHHSLRRSIERFVDGEAPPPEAAAAMVHLRRCRKCRAAAQLLARMKAGLRRRAQREPDPLAVTRLRRYAVTIAEEGIDPN